MVVGETTPIVISSTCASDHSYPLTPRYAPFGETGIKPFVIDATPTNLDVSVTFNVLSIIKLLRTLVVAAIPVEVSFNSPDLVEIV